MIDARPFLQLVRAGNLFTAVADVLAGFLFVGGGMESVGSMALLAGGSACFDAGGVVLNDVCDAMRDAAERSWRPIPSGAISRRGAGLLGAVLLAAGLVLCVPVSARAVRVGLVLLVCIILYDSVLKQTVLAPATMGMCRAANLLLGMSVVDDWAVPSNVFAAFSLWLYVASVTYFARFEAVESSRLRLGLGAAGVVTAIVGLVGVQSFLADANIWYLLLVGVLLGQVMVPIQRALTAGQPVDVQRAVKVMVLSVVLFDACLVFAARGPLLAAPVLVLLVPSILLGQRYRVT